MNNVRIQKGDIEIGTIFTIDVMKNNNWYEVTGTVENDKVIFNKEQLDNLTDLINK